MKTFFSIACMIVCLYFSTALVFAKNLPKDLRAASREYPASIEKEVQALNRKKLLDDSYFLKSLKTELKNKKHSDEEKVYYFYLMLRQIRWGFAGAVWIRPDGHYTEEVLFQCQTYVNYRSELQALKLDAKPFFQLCHDNASSKPLLASHALLLATMLERDDENAFHELADVIDSVLPTAGYPLRSMLIHNISYSLILLGKHEYKLPAFAVMMDSALLEEEKEDVVIGGSLSGDKDAVTWVFQTLISITDSADDLFAGTCMFLLKQMVSDESFKAMLDVYRSHAETDFQRKLADTIMQRDYAVPYLGPDWEQQEGLFTKFWDTEDVMFSMYDDGLYVSSGSFSEFIPN